jgi:hypothetical protein
MKLQTAWPFYGRVLAAAKEFNTPQAAWHFSQTCSCGAPKQMEQLPDRVPRSLLRSRS